MPYGPHTADDRAKMLGALDLTSVDQGGARRGLQTIAVTSATLGEGKTSVATNLAAVFSRAGASRTGAYNGACPPRIPRWWS